MNRLLLPSLLLQAMLLPVPAFAEVRIEGLTGELLANAQAHLGLDEESCDAPAWRVHRLLRQGQRDITTALQALGFYAADIQTGLSFEHPCWLAVYTVTAGEPVTIRTLDIQMAGDAENDPAFARVISEAGLQLQQPLRHDRYEALKRSLLDTLAQRGYADARLGKNEVTVTPADYAADVVLYLDSGNRYAFGETTFEQDVLQPQLVQRFLPYRHGDPYEGNLLADLYSALAGSGYFGRIDVKPDPEGREDGHIPVVVKLTPGKRKLYSAGIGYSTNTGARLRAGYTNRRMDSKGRQWGTSLLMSDVVSEIAINYRQPEGDPRTEWLSFDTGFKHERTDTSESDALQLGARRLRERKYDWRETRFVDLLVEDFEIAGQSRRSTFIIPGISWTRSRSSNRLQPQRGSRLFLEFRGSGDVLGSDTNFLRVEASGKLIRSLRPGLRVLVRTNAGASVSGEFSELPPSLRFFAGGDGSIRGYGFETLGSKDAAGNVIGGSGQLIASVELERALATRWSVAAFVDSGNAFDDFDLEAHTGAGIGGRWLSPIGPVRLDLAWPFNGADRDPRVHLSFGPDL
ncbi:MAG: autotransporter assembly complex protein TamA [Gammaproteobacteria bacterium]|nr:autotransporter assembly complex protein TamA [Gammaproteobacteria bacterium]